MNKAKDYIQLHLNILLFSLTSVFSKAASVQLNPGRNQKSSIICIFISDGCKLWHLRYCMAEGNQKILFVNRICKPQRLSDLVPDLGRDHFP